VAVVRPGSIAFCNVGSRAVAARGSRSEIPLLGDIRSIGPADPGGVTRLPLAVTTFVALFILVSVAVAPGISKTTRGHASPVNKSHPFIEGTAGPRSMLQAGTGSWRGRNVSYSFQWKRCNARGGNCDTVEGATGSSYLVSSGDANYTLRVSVTARNRYGSRTATSGPKRVGPPSTGSPTNASVSFDGRAKRMKRLYSVGVGNQGQFPRLWTCLCFMDNDISLTSDSDYGQVYKASVTIGDHNPWDSTLPTTSGAGQMSIRRKNDLGKWDWYAIALKVPSWSGPVTNISFVDILSVGYQTSQGDQVGLGLMDDNGRLAWQIHQNSGYANDPNGRALGSVNYTTPILPVSYGQWEEFVVGVKWATDKTGAVEVYDRTPGGSWRRIYERRNEPTYLYGTTPNGSFAQKGSNWPTVIDKIGLYYGEYGGIKPTETVYESGLTRSSDLATAQSTLR
jgi:hypothetical protein